MNEVLLYRVYIQKKNQWDDPLDSHIYILPIEEDKVKGNIKAYRYVVNKQDPKIALFSSSFITLELVWFLDYHELVERNTILLKNMLDTLRDQLAEMNKDAVSMASFYRRFRNMVERSSAL